MGKNKKAFCIRTIVRKGKPEGFHVNTSFQQHTLNNAVSKNEPLIYASQHGKEAILDAILLNRLYKQDTLDLERLLRGCIGVENNFILILNYFWRAATDTIKAIYSDIVFTVCQQGTVDQLQALLSKEVEVERCTFGLNDPLAVALERQDPKIISLLLKHGLDPNYTFQDMNTETLACENSNAECVDLLCAHGMIISGEVDETWEEDVQKVMKKWILWNARIGLLMIRTKTRLYYR